MFFFEIFKRARSNDFLKNVATLASGAVISQLVVIATSPILTRIYPVEAFGLLSLFTSYMVISAVISTGRYELAIILPEKDEDGRKLIQLIFWIGLLSAVVYWILIFVSKELLQLQNHFELLKYWWIYLAPLYIFFIAIYSALGYWYQRKKKYKKITMANAFQVILTSLLSVVFGLMHLDYGLILSLIISIFATILYFLSGYIKDYSFFSAGDVIAEGRKYISFPKYMTVSDLSLTASQQLTPIIFSLLFSTTVVGFYSMANRMLRLPNIVITGAIGNVFRNEAIDEIREKGNCEALYRSTFKKLIFMGLPIYLIIFIAAPTLFVLIFGEKWELAGYFARILSTMLFLEFIATPLNTLFYIREKQKILMRIQVLNAISGAIMIFLGYYFFKSASYSLVFFCINAIIFNSVFLLLTYRISKNGEI